MSTCSDWITVTFGEIAEQIIQRIDDPKDSELIDYIGLEHIESDNLRIANYGKSSDVVSSKFVCRKGDIIFGRRRTYLKKLAVSERDALVSTDAIIIRPKNKVSREFLILTMQTDKFWNEVISRSAGSLSPRIKWRDLTSIRVLVPSPEKQKEITTLVFSVQNNIEKTDNLLQVAEKLKKGMLEEFLTRGIGHREFKNTDLGEIPKEWEIVEIADVSRSVSYGYTASACNEPVGPKFLRITDIASGKINWNKVPFCRCSESEYEANHLKKDDIVFARTGASTGATGLIDADVDSVFASYLIRIVPSERINSRYLLLFFNTDTYWAQLRTYLAGSAQGGCNANSLRKMKLALPTLAEQNEITKIANSLFEFIEKIQLNLENLGRLKKKLTDSFISGDFTIPMEVLN
jgi:type I restriction enzyme, S subunit